jgi:delta-aminolevulinic acid dehydratase/porphobilinogen synthase
LRPIASRIARPGLRWSRRWLAAWLRGERGNREREDRERGNGERDDQEGRHDVSTRLRRLRRTATLRRMVRETRLSRDDRVLPLFVTEGRGVREPVASMPGVLRFSVDTLVSEAKQVRDLGIPAVLLFGVPAEKDARGSGADAANGVVQRAVDAIKSAEPDLCVITDVCLCEYTDHGHCGIVENGTSRTIRLSNGSRQRPSRTPAPAPTGWPRRT